MDKADPKSRHANPYLPLLSRQLIAAWLLLAGLPCHGQSRFDDLPVYLPDTTLTLESLLPLLEDSTGLYFSYNAEILDLGVPSTWKQGEYVLMNILKIIAERQEVEFTLIGNQVVFHLPGKEPGLVLPPEARDPHRIRSISGRIVSGMDQRPLEFATVWIPATWEGTISNAEGYFRINLPGPNPPDTIAIGCMGYASRRIPVSELHDSLNLILMNPAIIPIQEVIIRHTEPLNLIRQALDRLGENYENDPVLETAFYRESIQKNDKYVMVSEAVIEIYKPGGYSMDREQVRLLKGRKNLDFHETDTFMVKLKGGLQTSFMLDFVRYRPEFLDPELFYLYDYKLADIVTVNDRTTYAIEFNQKTHTDPPHYQGRIYIDMETLAFKGIDLEVNPQTISMATNAMVLKKPRNLKVRPLSAFYQVNYNYDGERFFLSLIRADVLFRVRDRKKLFGNKIRTLSEMAVTHLQTEGVARFRARETTDESDIFADLLGGYDPGFWGPYNIIIPDESMEEALNRISRLMESSIQD